MNTCELFPGMTLRYLELAGYEVNNCHHASSADILEINYCRAGRMGWNMKNGQSIYLGPGDFAINTQALCAESVMTLPNGSYEGLLLCIDIRKAQGQLPALLADAGMSLSALCAKFCADNRFSVLTGNEKTAPIFAGFFVEEDACRLSYSRLKAMELLLYLTRLDAASAVQPNRYQSEQVEIIRQIHDHLTAHLNERITISELANRFPLNTTTIKTVFKAVYGESIASHIRAHRMERAAELLSATNDSIAAIAEAVGYGNPSKFSTAFQETYQMLPLEYRRLHRKG